MKITLFTPKIKREWRSTKQPYKTYYFYDRFTHIEDVLDVIKKYKKVEGKKNHYWIKKNYDGSFDLYFTRVINLFG